MVRYFSLHANVHREKVKKASQSPTALRIIEEELRRLPSKGWAAMIRMVCEVDPMICPKCWGWMKIVAFITEVAVVDRIVEHLKLTFVAVKPPPSQVFEQVALLEVEESGGLSSFSRCERVFWPNMLFRLDCRIFRCL